MNEPTKHLSVFPSALKAEGPALTAIDPVCGMEIDPQHAAAKLEHNGQMYYFCNAGCAERFQTDPSRYLNPAPAAVETPVLNSSYICPMDPEVRERAPGPCPKCGMALEPEVAAAPPIRTEYVC